MITYSVCIEGVKPNGNIMHIASIVDSTGRIVWESKPKPSIDLAIVAAYDAANRMGIVVDNPNLL